jgi:hypothetical protein
MAYVDRSRRQRHVPTTAFDEEFLRTLLRPSQDGHNEADGSSTSLPVTKVEFINSLPADRGRHQEYRRLTEVDHYQTAVRDAGERSPTCSLL